MPAADVTTRVELGGAGRKRSEVVLSKITGVLKYGSVDPDVVQT